jgi:pimeloyl-ACP methyl ester carboxylesterase
MNYFLPGMGATSQMYGKGWRSLPDTAFLDWPDYTGEDTVSALARRLITEYHITHDDIVGGSSLGGIIAAEIAQHVGARRLILIGSAAHPDEISDLLNRLHPLIDFAPILFVQTLAGKIDDELCQMFRESDPDFVRAMCKAVFAWEGLRHLPTEVFRVHGRNDHVIPLPNSTNVIMDGGHLIALTHEDACVEAIRPLLTS